MSCLVDSVISLSIIFLFGFFITTEASDFEYLKHTCSTNKTFSPNSTYQFNLQTLLRSLSSHGTATQFYNTTSGGGGDGGETIYGSFICRGDVTNDTCQKCSTLAMQQITPRCPHSKEAIIWYHECFVRYSNRSFFSTVDEWPRFNFMNYFNITTNSTKEGSYGWLLAKTLSDAVGEAANAGPEGTKKFARKNATLSRSKRVYTLVQCTPDLSSEDCSKCLGDIMRDIPLCCLGRDGGMVLYPSLHFDVWVRTVLQDPRNPHLPQIMAHRNQNIQVWRQWKDQIPLSILDANMTENYSQIDVIKCIHIGLLCVSKKIQMRDLRWQQLFHI